MPTMPFTSCRRLCALAAILLLALSRARAADYWAAPAAAGAGDGSSSANAAYYLNSTFWSSTVQSHLSGDNVNVNFLNGNYGAGMLSFTNIGNPLHRLTLQAVNLYGPVFSTTGGTIVNNLGCQNIKFYGFVFTGPCTYWGVYCIPNYLRPCRNLEISYCQFLNLTNAYYAAIGLLNGTRDITVDNCAFTNITNGGHAHMIYAPHDIMGVVVTNCIFQDCKADYVRFRDDSEYCVVDHCTFISTMSATAFPFVSAELYNETNSDSAGDEFFGTYFQISSNSFIYNVSGGPGPYSALHFSDTGYSPQSYDCDLTYEQSTNLAKGTTNAQQSFLQTNMGIIASGIKMFGNAYSGVDNHVDYTYVWDGTAPYGGWQGTVRLDNVPDSSGALLPPWPKLRNSDFDRQGLLLTSISVGLKDYECLFRTWLCNPKYTDILLHPGFNGTTNAMRFDRTASQYIYQWISNPTTTWTMDCLFAIGSSFTGTGTKFKVDIFHNDIAGSKVSIGVNDSGQFGIYNGGTFTVLPELGTIAFSVDGNGNGIFTDPGDMLNVYRLRIVGNYAAASSYVNIYTSGANSMALNHQSLGKTYWVSGAPVGGQSAPGTIVFYNYTAPVVLDQIVFAAGLADQPPAMNSARFSNGKFIFSGTNGFAGVGYYILSSTNLALPLSNWTREATNNFDSATGAFSITNTMAPGAAQKFYRLQLQ